MKYWTIDQRWKGEPAVVIGSGPSLTDDQVNACRGRARVCVINDNYLKAPWADLHYFCDEIWWHWHRDRPEYRAFQGVRVTLENPGVTEPGVLHVHVGGRTGFYPTPDGICTGGNSGYQLIHILAHMGCSPILLLGLDMKLGPGDQVHWFGDHPRATPKSVFRDTMLPLFPELAEQLRRRKIDVVNCTPGSALQVFPCRGLQESLDTLRWPQAA